MEFCIVDNVVVGKAASENLLSDVEDGDFKGSANQSNDVEYGIDKEFPSAFDQIAHRKDCKKSIKFHWQPLTHSLKV